MEARLVAASFQNRIIICLLRAQNRVEELIQLFVAEEVREGWLLPYNHEALRENLNDVFVLPPNYLAVLES